MIRQQILHRSETSVFDYSKSQIKEWQGEVIDFRENGFMGPFSQEFFDVNKHHISAVSTQAKTYHRGCEFVLVLDVKMSNNDVIKARYSEISNNIKIDDVWAQNGNLRIWINGKEVKDFLGWSITSLSNFGSLRNFYFNSWIPSVQPA